MDNEEIMQKLITLEVKVENNEDNIKTLNKKTDEISSLNTTIALLNASVKNLGETVNKMNDKFNKMEDGVSSDKAKKWNTLTNTAISAIVGGIIGYFLMKMGIK